MPTPRTRRTHSKPKKHSLAKAMAKARLPVVSVITPLHAPGNPYIADTYKSLQAQTVQNWEWVIITNNGGKVPDAFAADPRIRVSEMNTCNGIGALKRDASARALAPWILELDADDLIAPTALERVIRAFETGADFVYSDFAEFQDGTWAKEWPGYPYAASAGWECSTIEFGDPGHELIAMHAPPATAHNVRMVDWAPNHLRAWTRAAYWAVGGHDATMAVADDHDLIVRFFLAGKTFQAIEECLYAYRVHAKNTVKAQNAAIRAATDAVYERSIWKLGEKFAKDGGLKLIDLCGAIDKPAGYTSLDAAEGADVRCDLNGRWPLADSSVGVLRAHDAVEHLRDPIHTMNEAWRVLAPGGFFMISVPSSEGRGAHSDPTHVSYWNRLSFRHYTDPTVARYTPAFTGRFQASRVLEWFPSEWHRAENVPYVAAHLFCVKDGFRAMGDFKW